MSHVRFLGVRVDDVTLDEAIDQALAFVASGKPHQIATVNPEFVMAAQRDADFRKVLEAADLCVPDGVGLMWGARLLRRPLRGRVPGVELVWRLAEVGADQGWTVFLLGGRDGAGRITADRLQSRFASLRVAGIFEGSPTDPASVERVRAATPDVLLVAYGAPAQDVWIAQHAADLHVPLAIGVGGAFDYISGRAKRAPAWLRRLGLEWLHRLVHQPWRWRRMLALPRFGAMVLRQRWKAPSSSAYS